MIKTARQLKDLIRNLSKDKSADAQILMRNYMMERFLERISLSEYRDKFILKGGMLVAAMVGLDARSTMDIDATVKGATVGIEEVENMIASIISVPVDDGVEFRLKRISEIMDEAEYPGIRVSMETEFDVVITPLKIDISTGDAITPREVRYSFTCAQKHTGSCCDERRASSGRQRFADAGGSGWIYAHLLYGRNSAGSQLLHRSG